MSFSRKSVTIPIPVLGFENLNIGLTCGICGAEGVTQTTCPHPAAPPKKKKPDKHNPNPLPFQRKRKKRKGGGGGGGKDWNHLPDESDIKHLIQEFHPSTRVNKANSCVVADCAGEKGQPKGVCHKWCIDRAIYYSEDARRERAKAVCNAVNSGDLKAVKKAIRRPDTVINRQFDDEWDNKTPLIIAVEKCGLAAIDLCHYIGWLKISKDKWDESVAKFSEADEKNIGILKKKADTAEAEYVRAQAYFEKEKDVKQEVDDIVRELITYAQEKAEAGDEDVETILDLTAIDADERSAYWYAIVYEEMDILELLCNLELGGWFSHWNGHLEEAALESDNLEIVEMVQDGLTLFEEVDQEILDQYNVKNPEIFFYFNLEPPDRVYIEIPKVDSILQGYSNNEMVKDIVMFLLPDPETDHIHEAPYGARYVQWTFQIFAFQLPELKANLATRNLRLIPIKDEDFDQPRWEVRTINETNEYNYSSEEEEDEDDD